MYLIWEIVMKTILKISLIGFITTIFRIIRQVLIPESGTSQTTLLPSVFVKNGTLPFVFSLYGFFTYNISDMILRTIIDFSAVTIGCLAFRKTQVI